MIPSRSWAKPSFMTRRRLFGCLPVAALAVCALTACKDDSGDSKQDAGATATPSKQAAAPASAEQLSKRCEQLGKACGELDKHQQAITNECKQAAKKQVEKGCAGKTIAAYDCFEREICAKITKVWALDDFRVLVDRHLTCVVERSDSNECVTAE